MLLSYLHNKKLAYAASAKQHKFRYNIRKSIESHFPQLRVWNAFLPELSAPGMSFSLLLDKLVASKHLNFTVAQCTSELQEQISGPHGCSSFSSLRDNSMGSAQDAIMLVHDRRHIETCHPSVFYVLLYSKVFLAISELGNQNRGRWRTRSLNELGQSILEVPVERHISLERHGNIYRCSTGSQRIRIWPWKSTIPPA